MKAAFFTYTRLEYGGGVAKYFIDISAGLKKRYKNLDIDIITFDERTLKILLFGYFIYFIGNQDLDMEDKESYSDIKKKIGDVGYYKVSFFQLKKKLRQYDVLYTTNNLLEILLFEYLIGYRSLPPVVYGFHVPIFYEIATSIQSKIHNILYDTYIYKHALRGAFKLHVLNNYDLTNVKKGIPDSQVVKIYNPFDFGKFASYKNMFRYKYKWEKNKFNIIWVGRLTKEKGIDDLIEIIDRVNELIYKDKIVWNIFGDGDCKSRIIDLTRRWKNVNFHGYLKNVFMSDILNNNDLFITTSKAECFPYSLIEAQTQGLPVVGYDIHGVNDIIDNGINGYLVKSKKDFIITIYNMIKKNCSLIDNKKIKSYIRNKFNTEKLYKDIYSLFGR